MSSNQSQFALFSVMFRKCNVAVPRPACKTLGLILKSLCCELDILDILLKIQCSVDPDKHSLSQFHGVLPAQRACFKVDC